MKEACDAAPNNCVVYRADTVTARLGKRVSYELNSELRETGDRILLDRKPYSSRLHGTLETCSNLFCCGCRVGQPQLLVDVLAGGTHSNCNGHNNNNHGKQRHSLQFTVPSYSVSASGKLGGGTSARAPRTA